MYNYISIIDHKFDTPVVTQIRSKFPNKATGVSLSPRLLDVVWSIAARIQQEIKARLNSGVRNDVLPILQLVHNWRSLQEGEAALPIVVRG